MITHYCGTSLHAVLGMQRIGWTLRKLEVFYFLHLFHHAEQQTSHQLHNTLHNNNNKSLLIHANYRKLHDKIWCKNIYRYEYDTYLFQFKSFGTIFIQISSFAVGESKTPHGQDRVHVVSHPSMRMIR